MKKFLSKIIATFITATSCISISSLAADNLGDCNGDGMIDAKDASAILIYYSAISTGNTPNLSDKYISSAADVNGDGIVDSKDASVTLGYYSYISSNEDYKTIPEYIEYTKDFKVANPISIKASEDGNYLNFEWDNSDQADGYEISLVQYYTVLNEWDYKNKELVSADAMKENNKISIQLPKIKLENTDYRYFKYNYDGENTELIIYPELDYINVNMKPYKLRDGKKVYKEDFNKEINPYGIAFSQQETKYHDEIPVYNEQGEKPYLSWTSSISANDRKILEEFEKEHFKGDEDFFERLDYMSRWIKENFTYANAGTADWDEIVNVSWVDATLKHKKGQCIQYNGALAAYATYKGYKVKMIQGWVKGTTDWQHFWGVIMLDDSTEYVLDLAIT